MLSNLVECDYSVDGKCNTTYACHFNENGSMCPYHYNNIQLKNNKRGPLLPLSINKNVANKNNVVKKVEITNNSSYSARSEKENKKENKEDKEVEIILNDIDNLLNM